MLKGTIKWRLGHLQHCAIIAPKSRTFIRSKGSHTPISSHSPSLTAVSPGNASHVHGCASSGHLVGTGSLLALRIGLISLNIMFSRFLWLYMYQNLALVLWLNIFHWINCILFIHSLVHRHLGCF